MLTPESRIYVAGHRGLVGSAIVRALDGRGFKRLILRTHLELDLLDQKAVTEFFAAEKPDYVIFAAARVGGIWANTTRPAEFIYQNLMMGTNAINAAFQAGVRHFLFLGSSCIYPRLAVQPITEEALLTDSLEPTNAPYAVAKIAGIVLCDSYNRQYGTKYRSIMPTNLYGPNDNFDLERAHVLPALIRRFHEAKTARVPKVTLWGTGTPRREFLHVDDLARACLILLADEGSIDLVNVGVGEDISIRDLATMIAKIIGYKGEIGFDASRPDGTPRKLLDSSRIRRLGWTPKISLEEGISLTYEWYRTHAR
jgi:GDP-L-fucose synthase